MTNTFADSSNTDNYRKLVHIDQKVLVPGDRVGTSTSAWSEPKTQSLGNGTDVIEKLKSIIGLPKIYDLKGNLLAEEENLVVLIGREFLAQKLIGSSQGASIDYTQYKVDYFGIGSGGTTLGTIPDTVGPYDLDTNLSSPIQFTTTSGDINSSLNSYKYIDGGFLKKIKSDGSVAITQEEHEVNTATEGLLTVQRFTSIKFTLKIDISEPSSKPAKFNEAGLWAVKFDANGVPLSQKVLFARFTTLDKYLDTNDGLIIEWHILV